ncbi:hypothetical protein [Roseivirga seohaensis]|uniref:hypothetical protein n=1 Tax=Roseivirga seohaensis TaxID=1914963 RepID=UPI003BACB8CD
MTVTIKELQNIFDEAEKIHRISTKFWNWVFKKYGKGLKGGKLRSSDYFLELSKRMVGWEVIEAIEKFVEKECPEVKIVWVDDQVHSSSILVLIPHPKMGVTILFVPQNTRTNNFFFMYPIHVNNLMEALNELKPTITKPQNP